MTTNALREITQEEMTSYWRDGAVLLRKIMPQDWLERVAQGLEEARRNPGDMSTVSTDASGRGQLFADQFASLRIAALKDVVAQSPAAAIAGKLQRTQHIRYYLDQIFYKEAGRVLPSSWHQDTPYLNIEGFDFVRTWIPVDVTPKAIGMKFVRGSHRWNAIFKALGPRDVGQKEQGGGKFSYGNAEFDQSLPAVPEIDRYPDSFDVIGWDAEPGDVVVFQAHMLHAAGAMENYPRQRRAFTIMWAGDDARYRRRRGHSVPDLSSIRGVAHQDGDAFAKYPDVYPLVWSAQG